MMMTSTHDYDYELGEHDIAALNISTPHVLHMGAFRHAPRMVDTVTNTPIQPALVRSVDFSDDGLHCVTACGDGKLRTYDVGAVCLRDQLLLGCAQAKFSHSSAIAITTPLHASNASVGFLDIERSVYVSNIPVSALTTATQIIRNSSGDKRDREGSINSGGEGSSSMMAVMGRKSWTDETGSSSGSPIISKVQGVSVGPLCTSLSVNPLNDVTCVGCSSGDVFLVDPSQGAPLAHLVTSTTEGVISSSFSQCGKYVGFATIGSVEVHTLAAILSSPSTSSRGIHTMSAFHKRACTGYASLQFGSSSSAMPVVMASCGCGGIELLSFNDKSGTAASCSGGRLTPIGGSTYSSPDRCFGPTPLIPNTTGLPFHVPPPSSCPSSASDIVTNWRPPSCGALFATPESADSSLLVQGTIVGSVKPHDPSGPPSTGGTQTYSGIVIRDPIPTRRNNHNTNAPSEEEIQRTSSSVDDISLARTFLSTDNDSAGAPRVIAVNPRFGIVAGAHRVLNWWALN